MVKKIDLTIPENAMNLSELLKVIQKNYYNKFFLKILVLSGSIIFGR